MYLVLTGYLFDSPQHDVAEKNIDPETIINYAQNAAVEQVGVQGVGSSVEKVTQETLVSLGSYQYAHFIEFYEKLVHILLGKFEKNGFQFWIRRTGKHSIRFI